MIKDFLNFFKCIPAFYSKMRALRVCRQTVQVSGWPWQNTSNRLELQLYLSDMSNGSNAQANVTSQEDDVGLYLLLPAAEQQDVSLYIEV